MDGTNIVIGMVKKKLFSRWHLRYCNEGGCNVGDGASDGSRTLVVLMTYGGMMMVL